MKRVELAALIVGLTLVFAGSIYYVASITNGSQRGGLASSLILHVSVRCMGGAAGNATGDAYCLVSVNNTGTADTAVIGCTLDDSRANFGAGETPPVESTPSGVTVPTAPSPPTEVVCDGIAFSPGATVTGNLAFTGGFAPAFTAMAT
jgi:hypothetical protein